MLLLGIGLVSALAGDPEARRAFVSDVDAASAGTACRYFTDAPEHVVEHDVCGNGDLAAMVESWTQDCATARDLGFVSAEIVGWDGRATCQVADCACAPTSALDEGERAEASALWASSGQALRDGETKDARRDALRLRRLLVGRLGPDHPHVVLFVDDWLATLSSASGDVDEAVTGHRGVLDAYEGWFGPDAAETAPVRGRYGEALLASGRWREAMEELEQASRDAEASYGDRSPAYAEAEERVADAALKLGDWQRADLAVRRALPIRQDGDDPVRWGATLARWGDLLAATGSLVAAQQMYTVALQLFEGGAVGVDDALRARVGAAFVQQRLDAQIGSPDPNGALARALADRIRYNGLGAPETADVFEVIARQNRTALLVQKSGRASLMAWRIRHRSLGDGHPDTARALAVRGSQDLVQGRLARGMGRLEAALAAQDAVLPQDHRDRGETLAWLALGSQLEGDLATARSRLAESGRIGDADLDRVFSVAGEAGKRAWLVQRQNEMLRAVAFHARYAPDDPEAARLAYQAVLSRKARFTDAALDDLLTLRDAGRGDLVGELAAAQADVSRLVLGGPEAARGLELSDDVSRMIQGGLLPYDPNTPEGYWQLAMTDAVSAVAALEGDVAAFAAVERDHALTPKVADVAAALPEGGALVEIVAWAGYTLDADSTRAGLGGGFEGLPDRYLQMLGVSPFLHPTAQFPTEWRYAAYVVRPDGSVGWADLGAVVEVDALVDGFREALRDCDGCRGTRATATRAARVDPAKEAREKGRALDAATWEKLEPLLGGATHVFVAPDGPLSLVPFEALVGPDGDPRVRDATITMLGSGRDLVRAPHAGVAGSAPLVVADPAYGSAGEALVADAALRSGEGMALGDLRGASWSRLEGTRQEAEAVAALVPDAVTLVDAEATEAALKAVAGPRFLHVASHGYFLPPDGPVDDIDQDPRYRSGLVLAGAGAGGDGEEDGLLTAAEVMGLDLRGTRLVVLSACETGTGTTSPGQGVLGLRYAFLLAGAESQVMSLWSVSDAATAELMTAYYRRLAAGEGRAEALRNAKLELLDAGRWTHPYYWAAFVHSGAWGPIPGE